MILHINAQLFSACIKSECQIFSITTFVLKECFCLVDVKMIYFYLCSRSQSDETKSELSKKVTIFLQHQRNVAEFLKMKKDIG